jgi:ribosomal protein L40E
MTIIMQIDPRTQGELIVFALAQMFLWGWIGYAAAMKAEDKGYAKVWSIVICTPFGLLSLFFVFLLPSIGAASERLAADEQPEQEQVHSQETFVCPNCARRNPVSARLCSRCDQRFD